MNHPKLILHSEFDITAIVNVCFHRLSKDFVFSGETPDYWGAFYVDRGSVIINTETNTYFMNNGELAFHHPGEFRGFRAVGEADVLVFSFYCDSEAMNRLKKKIVLLHHREKNLLKLLVDEAQQVFSHFEGDPPLVNLEKKDTAPWGCDQLIKTYLEQLLIFICRREQNIDFTQRTFTTNNVRQGYILSQYITEYIKKHFTEHITLESLSNTLGISVSQLKRIFREHIGQSMVSYLTAQRIGHAKRLIREGELSFTQIAEQVGYDSIYYFSAIFKKKTGMTLTEYKKSIKS